MVKIYIWIFFNNSSNRLPRDIEFQEIVDRQGWVHLPETSRSSSRPVPDRERLSRTLLHRSEVELD